MRQLTMISHFNGIGLFPLAAAQAGILTIATTEIDPFCNAISARHFPHATQYTDIRQATGLPYADIVCGGDPCQPHSSAGKRAGSADVRFLWPAMLACIQSGQPAWVVNENVVGSITNGVLDGKAADLEALGYEVAAFDIPSGAVGGPSRRNRAILVAHGAGQRLQRSQALSFAPEKEQAGLRQPASFPGALGPALRNADIPTLLRMANGCADGLDSRERRQRIKSLGNGIDPHVFVPIFQAIAAIEAA